MSNLAQFFGGSVPVGAPVTLASYGSYNPWIVLPNGQEYLLQGAMVPYAAKYANACALNPQLKRYGYMTEWDGANFTYRYPHIRFAHDGTRLWAAVATLSTQIDRYYSTDNGVTWTLDSNTMTYAPYQSQIFHLKANSGGCALVTYDLNGNTFNLITWTGTGAVPQLRASSGSPLNNASGIIWDGTNWYVHHSSGYAKRVAASPDGVWTTGAGTNMPQHYDGIAGNGTIFVSWGNAGVKSSSDGATWTSRSFPTGVGASGKQWITQSSSVYCGASTVAWDGTNFIAIVKNNNSTNAWRVCTSSNGTTWTLGSTDLPLSGDEATIRASIVSDGAGTALISAVGTSSAVGQLLVSTDHGATWFQAPTPFNPAKPDASSNPGTLLGPLIDYSNGRFWFSGYNTPDPIQVVRSATPTQLAAGSATPDYVGALPYSSSAVYYRIV